MMKIVMKINKRSHCTNRNHLAHNLEVHEKVYEDVGSDVTYEQLNKLRLLQNDLEIDGYTIPAGANISIAPRRSSQQSLIEKPFFYMRIDELVPRTVPHEMYLDKPSTRTAFFLKNAPTSFQLPYNFIPFSAGIKNCSGQKCSILNEKVIM
ncbi:unnamed protein product [Caenorhabditis sp. 36 PRJEB53466]|nr:unnamed protein product [Caenorhabditis sp. 36 PRJEB53466]